MAESSPKGQKTVGKGEIACHKTHKNQGLFGKGLMIHCQLCYNFNRSWPCGVLFMLEKLCHK